MVIEAVQLCQEVEERYRQYLEATFHFRDRELRNHFRSALERNRLSKGPYIEATPVFARGASLGELVPRIVDTMPEEPFLRALQGDRRLYVHQEQAIEMVARDHNVVVTTGTGSGKTEAFLFPILLSLYREHLDGSRQAGVRALILYPMNALINDQRERLGQVAAALSHHGSSFRFTFGQYVGSTPEDGRDVRRHADERCEQGLPGELVLRSEMRATPPDILLTNYSMLEYLLLRPDDSPLFDGGNARHWRFIVLDEAHQYRGAKGIEMAMLIRRLKERLRAGGQMRPFRCIATSATIAGGEEEGAEVAGFATDLFGEPFDATSVIMGTTVSSSPRAAGTTPLEGPPTPPTDPAVGDCGVRQDGDEGSVPAEHPRLSRLRELLAGGPRLVPDVADGVFPDLPTGERVEALTRFVDQLVRTQDISGAPLLSTRYHFFLRSLEGAFVSFWPEPLLTLDRGGWGEGGTGFEVALCRECGAHYLVGSIRGDRLVEAVRDPGSAEFSVRFFRPVTVLDPAGPNRRFRLCVTCGRIQDGASPEDHLGCGHRTDMLLEEERASGEHEDQVSRCGACGYSARDPVQEVVHGTDGPHAVIATTLVRELPQDRHKVLAFADSRQEAAFFAWYLDHSYREILARNLICREVRSASTISPTGLSLAELAASLFATMSAKGMFPPTAGELERRRQAWLLAYAEFLTEHHRLSLEGTGLVRWILLDNVCCDVLQTLPTADWPIIDGDKPKVVAHLLSTLRQDGAVTLKARSTIALDWAALDRLGPQTAVRMGGSDTASGARSWDTDRGRRHLFLCTVARRAGLDENTAQQFARKVLGGVWEALSTHARQVPGEEGALERVGPGAKRLNPDWWRAVAVQNEDQIFRCKVCGRIEHRSISGVCPRTDCPGTLEPLVAGDLVGTHYRRLYTEDLPGRLRVEEHTAQIEHDRAQDLQRDFKEGRIDVLSCSTTFEMGVDLGDLDTVFMRNVPPEAFNYAQRVGRSGRRSGSVGLAITYCRRNPHDLYHFTDPERIIRGTVSAPRLALRNSRIILRHLVAVILSDFFRTHPERFRTVAGFAGQTDSPDLREQVMAHLRSADLHPLLQQVAPRAVWDELGLTDSGWIDRVAGEQSRLSEALRELQSDTQGLLKMEAQARDSRDYDKAAWAKARLNTIEKEDALSFLSRKAVIPKYGFPVDVVELETTTARTQRPSAVTLQRDLAVAIAEFAPSSHVIADKLEWVSAALKQLPEQRWPWKTYWRCPVHNRVETVARGQELSSPCCASAVRGEYIVPRWGFLVGHTPPKEPRRRASRLYTTRPHFLGWAQTPNPRTRGPLQMHPASPGTLVVLSEGRRGRGFYICEVCGAGFERPAGKRTGHRNAHGGECRGSLHRVALGHEFTTDAVQIEFTLPPPAFTLASSPESLAYSLSFALMEGLASVVDVPSSDLGATVTAGTGTIPAVVLYDAVPGGAGLVAHLEDGDVLRRCIEAAHARIGGDCGCGESESCYGCLRSYRNQFIHTQLHRGPAHAYLGDVVRALE